MKRKSTYRIAWQCESNDTSDWLNTLPNRFDFEGEVIYNGRNVVKRMTLPNETVVVVKRFKRPLLFQRMIYSRLRMSKGLRACVNSKQLLQRNIETPAPIACIEERLYGIYQRAWYVYTYYKGTPLGQLDLTDKALIDDLAEYAAKLHSSGVMDLDFNVGNILCNQSDEHWSFSLIDTNRIRFMPIGVTPKPKYCIKTLLTLPTSMDFRYLMSRYLTVRGLYTDKNLAKAIAMKDRHDKRYFAKKRIKSLFR